MLLETKLAFARGCKEILTPEFGAANILLRYLGEEGKGTPLKAAASLCNPFDLVWPCQGNTHEHVPLCSRLIEVAACLSQALSHHPCQHVPQFQDIYKPMRRGRVQLQIKIPADTPSAFYCSPWQAVLRLPRLYRRCTSLQVICDDNFHKGFNRIYDVSLALSLRRLFLKYSDQFQNLGGEWNTELAASCWSIREFDDAITRVCFKWPSVDAYYAGEFKLRVWKCADKSLQTSPPLRREVESTHDGLH